MIITKEKFKELCYDCLVALEGYKYDKNGHTRIEIFGMNKLYNAINLLDKQTEKEHNRNLLIEYEIFKKGESLDSDVPNGTKIDAFLNSRNQIKQPKNDTLNK